MRTMIKTLVFVFLMVIWAMVWMLPLGILGTMVGHLLGMLVVALIHDSFLLSLALVPTYFLACALLGRLFCFVWASSPHVVLRVGKDR